VTRPNVWMASAAFHRRRDMLVWLGHSSFRRVRRVTTVDPAVLFDHWPALAVTALPVRPKPFEHRLPAALARHRDHLTNSP
jgi:hypothetical protein